MSSSSSVSFLENRKDAVESNIKDAKETISAAEDKIQRLRRISSSLETSIQSLKNLKGEIDDHDLSDAQWKGEERTQFEAKYNSYGIFVGVYESDTSKAKEQIDEELEAAKQEKSLAQVDMFNLNGTLDGLESNIKLAKED